MFSSKPHRSFGFTIVEVIVAITVVAILAGISIVSYGAWQTSIRQDQVKNDLMAAAGAMENERTFGESYPLTLPPSFAPSKGSQLVLSIGSPNAYCIDGTFSGISSIKYYIDNLTRAEGAQEGTCAARSVAASLSAPTNATITNFSGTSLTLTWSVVTGATGYKIQCSPDQAYIVIVASATASGGTTSSYTFGDVNHSSTYYCRVKAVNATSESPWTQTGSGTRDGTLGSLPVATSLEGYWTSAPEGFLFEDGSAISRTAYADLFAVIGTTYGSGDGSTTFNLPNSRGRTTVNKNASDVEFATIGQKTGSINEQITVGQIPSHNHLQYTGTVDDRNFTGWSFTPYPQYPPGDSSGSYNTGLVTCICGAPTNSAHNNVQHSIVKRSVIKYTPISPTAPTLPAGTSISGYWNSAPSGYLIENGATISRTSYASLFSSIGTTYGAGDGSTTFSIPDSRGRVGVNLSSSNPEFDTLGEKPGSKTEALTIEQIPSHNHYQTVGQPDDQNFTSGSGQYPPGDGPGTNNTGVYTGYAGSGQAHNNIQPAITKLSVIKHTPASGSKPVPVGSSIGGYWNSIPSGYLYEDGAAVSRTTYAELFNIIGTTYGSGDGSTTFNLPDSRGRIGVNISPADPLFDTMGEKHGSKTHTLSPAELPPHAHIQYIGPTDDLNFTSSPGQIPPGDGPGQYNQGQVTGMAGGGGAHNNIMPSIVRRYVIKY